MSGKSFEQAVIKKRLVYLFLTLIIIDWMLWNIYIFRNITIAIIRESNFYKFVKMLVYFYFIQASVFHSVVSHSRSPRRRSLPCWRSSGCFHGGKVLLYVRKNFDDINQHPKAIIKISNKISTFRSNVTSTRIISSEHSSSDSARGPASSSADESTQRGCGSSGSQSRLPSRFVLTSVRRIYNFK